MQSSLGVSGPLAVSPAARPSLLGHLEIARIDHWVKNVFVVPGFLAAVALDPAVSAAGLWVPALVALLSVGLVASSNYTLNEVLDAPYDRHHPTKHTRAVPAGRVHIPLAYVQWLVLGALGISIGWFWISGVFALVVGTLWVMGLLYNIPPVRTKDLAYFDVTTEAINNPLRMLAGWFALSAATIPPVSLLAAYWMIGCFFMAIKRLAEYRHIGDPVRIAAYRRSLAAVSERRLLITIMFYGSVSMLFFGAFIMRYRIEMILCFPLVAAVMAMYFNLAFDDDSAAQHPEKLYRDPRLMFTVAVCTAAMLLFLFVDVPFLHHIFAPTIPEAVQVLK
jgi:decaprenyl-phosphate phosphoribosyltransferase